MPSQAEINSLLEFAQIFGSRAIGSFGLNLQSSHSIHTPLKLGDYHFYLGSSGENFFHIKHINLDERTDAHCCIETRRGGIAIFNDEITTATPSKIIRTDSTDLSDSEYKKLVKLLDRAYTTVHLKNPDLITGSHPSLRNLPCNCSDFISLSPHQRTALTALGGALSQASRSRPTAIASTYAPGITPLAPSAAIDTPPPYDQRDEARRTRFVRGGVNPAHITSATTASTSTTPAAPTPARRSDADPFATSLDRDSALRSRGRGRGAEDAV